jgi:hypothetical protein
MNINYFTATSLALIITSNIHTFGFHSPLNSMIVWFNVVWIYVSPSCLNRDVFLAALNVRVVITSSTIIIHLTRLVASAQKIG